MNNKVNIDVNTIKLLYNKYKEVAIPVFVIIVCLLLFMKFIIPQFKVLFALGREAKSASSTLSVLKNNLNLLSGLSDSTLDSQLDIANKALPINKDFIGIINAISYASSIAGVGVGDFQLEIGDLSQAPTDTAKLSSISLNLSINGSIDNINKFITALSETLPLSEVTSINIGDASSNVGINFYYKPLPPVKYNDSTPINPIPETGLTVINNLSTNFNYNFSDILESVGSPSGSLPNPL